MEQLFVVFCAELLSWRTDLWEEGTWSEKNLSEAMEKKNVQLISKLPLPACPTRGLNPREMVLHAQQDSKTMTNPLDKRS